MLCANLNTQRFLSVAKPCLKISLYYLEPQFMTDISPRFELLSSLLLELIAILRDRQGDTWTAIAKIAAHRAATIAIDDTRLYIQVAGSPELEVQIQMADPDGENSFETTGEALRDILFGRSSLEKSVASGKVFIRANFSNLLKIRAIVASVLLDTEVEPRLLEVWQKFDLNW